MRRQTQKLFDILEVGGKAEKPWIWREQICICPTFNLNLAKQVYMALLCCYTTETSRTLLKSLTFRKPSLPNGWKGDEQMQEVSLESPFLVSFAHIGDKRFRSLLWGNGRQGDEQMEVSLVSSCSSVLRTLGTNLYIKNVADLLPSLSLDVDC